MDTPLNSSFAGAAAVTAATAVTAGPVVHTLRRGEVLALRGPAGQTLQVLSGRLWLTRSGDATDHFIASGECWTAAPAARLVLEGDSDTPTRWRWLLSCV